MCREVGCREVWVRARADHASAGDAGTATVCALPRRI
jgi:hypothetical protein